MASGEPIDLHHRASPRVIASYLVETSEGPALFDCGPTSTIDALEAGVRERGLELADIDHLLLSHIHLDHAGAAGVLVRRNPELQVHVSGVGAPHLIDPSRLERSARRLYGEHFDPLWGELAPVPEANVHVVGDDVLGLHCFPTVGHAYHHVSYLHEDGTLYAGDAAGVRIVPSTYVIPPTPPPDIDVDAWHATIEDIRSRKPGRLALIHFGVVDDVDRHLDELERQLDTWAERVLAGASEQEFVDAATADLEAAGVSDRDDYDHAIPFASSYLGLARWAEKRRDSAA
jgi:glyoxylase-like metal-dependent hydrolase (beta-lactamase superfamily II)